MAADPAFDGLQVRLRQQRPISLDMRLEVAAGELLALIGPSGSGKTTVLRCIAGIHGPSEGYVACAGERWLDSAAGIALSPQRRRVGFVFQDYALFPHLSALANVAMALGHLPRTRRAARAAELLELVHLGGLEARRPRQLSGGQRQRVALARALAREPAVLLLDEPLSAVDQVTRRKLQQELVLLRREVRVPIVLVTHDLREANALADRVCVLHRGVSLQVGRPDEVVNRPVSALVARLVDQSNVFQGVVHESDAAGRARIDWHGRLLEVAEAPRFAPGERVTWMVPPSHVLLHRRGRPSRGERENPVDGGISEMLVLGEHTLVRMHVDEDPGSPISFDLPTHAARRNALAVGERIRVSLLSDGIHLMPWSDLLEARGGGEA